MEGEPHFWVFELWKNYDISIKKVRVYTVERGSAHQLIRFVGEPSLFSGVPLSSQDFFPGGWVL